MKRSALPLLVAVAVTLASSTAFAQSFTYDPPGILVPTRSGRGRVDSKVYSPTMRFPMEQPNAYANSQVYARGGLGGDGGTECDVSNYSYPWHDNYCEIRDWDMPLCPAGTGHQGQDIRANTCEKDKHWVVAASTGNITAIGSYSVYLTAPDGTRFDYLHMSNVQVKVGDRVTRGQRIGKVSNLFGGNLTPIHLHFNIRQTVSGIGEVYVPPYMSLIESYKKLLASVEPPTDAGANPGVDASPEPPTQPPAPTAVADAGPALEAKSPPTQAGGCGCAESSGTPGNAALPLLACAAVLRRRKSKRTPNY
jgi:uncharacterized protein (TIGR03382 family)